MNYFWDRLEGAPGVRAHRPAKGSDRSMGGWYFPHGLYKADELGGLPIERFCEALRAEGFPAAPGANGPLHVHPAVNEADIYGDGMPTVVANAAVGADGRHRDVRARPGSLSVSESIDRISFSVPWFKKHRPRLIDQYAQALKKVVAHAPELME
jgi:hypothetical protein